MNQDLIVVDNFLCEQELAVIESALQKLSRDAIPLRFPWGPFANQLISDKIHLHHDTEVMSLLYQRIRPLFDAEIKIQNCSQQTLHLPWDVHTDYYLSLAGPGWKPYYNILISLEDIDSTTIIFDQITKGEDFKTYKEAHSPVAEPIDQDFWDQHLSMCWPNDRQYLTLKKQMPPQRRGQLQAFPREYFHSSDSFHLKFPGRNKKFIQLLVDRKDEI